MHLNSFKHRRKPSATECSSSRRLAHFTGSQQADIRPLALGSDLVHSTRRMTELPMRVGRKQETRRQ
jgi:hypothetical protein